MTSASRVIVGACGSPGSIRAMRYARDLAGRSGAMLVVVHAWTPPGGDVADRRSPSPYLRRVWQQAAWQRVRDCVDAAWGGMPADVETRLVVAQGLPGPVLADFANGSARPGRRRGRPARAAGQDRPRPGGSLLPGPRGVPGPGHPAVRAGQRGRARAARDCLSAAPAEGRPGGWRGGWRAGSPGRLGSWRRGPRRGAVPGAPRVPCTRGTRAPAWPGGVTWRPCGSPSSGSGWTSSSALRMPRVSPRTTCWLAWAGVPSRRHSPRATTSGSAHLARQRLSARRALADPAGAASAHAEACARLAGVLCQVHPPRRRGRADHGRHRRRGRCA